MYKFALLMLVFIVVFTVIARSVFNLPMGDIADWVGGIGTILAICSVYLQSQISEDNYKSHEEDRRNREQISVLKNAQPFDVTLYFDSMQNGEESTYLYDASRGNEYFGENFYEKISSILQKLKNKNYGTLNFEIVGEQPIYNVQINFFEKHNLQEVKHNLTIPMIQPNKTYVILTSDTLLRLSKPNALETSMEKLAGFEYKLATNLSVEFLTTEKQFGKVIFENKRESQKNIDADKDAQNDGNKKFFIQKTVDGILYDEESVKQNGEETIVNIKRTDDYDSHSAEKTRYVLV